MNLKRFLLKLGALIGAALVALFFIKKINQAVQGRLKDSSSFLQVPGDPGKIYVKNQKTGKWETAQLPEDVKYQNIRAACISEGGEVIVEIKHEVVDRRSGGPVDENACDRLRGRSGKSCGCIYSSHLSGGA
jgi:hypothetical protein